MKGRNIIIVVLIVFAGIAIYFVANRKDNEQNLTVKTETPTFKKEGELTFISNVDEKLTVINIEVADDNQKTAQGLMFRTSLPENAGMLFLMPREEIQGFWMKNTYIPLDMIFVNSNKEIVTIHANTVPMNENSYISTSPASFVIEVNAGYCNKNNIKEGDKIDFTISK